MRDLEFHIEGLDPDQVRRWRRQHPQHLPQLAACVGGLIAVLYASHYPGELRIAPSVSESTTTARFIDISGVVDHANIHNVAIDVNGSYHLLHPESASA